MSDAALLLTLLSHQIVNTGQVIPFVLSALGVGGILAAVTVAVAADVRAPGGTVVVKVPKPRLPKKPRAAAAPQAVRTPKAAPPATPKPAPTTDPVLLAARQAGRVKVRLAFPGIESGFPDVWGAQEPLLIEVATAGQAVDAVELTLGTTVVRERLFLRPWSGSTRLERSIPTPMEMRVAAIAKDASGQVVGYAERDLRVVDYRAEIVETFTDFRDWLRETHPDVDERLTARELLEALAARYPAAPGAAWDDIALAFEEAHYSDHPIARPHYARMVKGFLALEEAGLVVG